MFCVSEQNASHQQLGEFSERYETFHTMVNPRGWQGRSTWATHIRQSALVGSEKEQAIEIVIHQTLSTVRCAIYGLAPR